MKKNKLGILEFNPFSNVERDEFLRVQREQEEFIQKFSYVGVTNMVYSHIAKGVVNSSFDASRVQLGDTVYAAFFDVCNSGESIIEPYEVRYIAYDGNKWFVAGEDMELFELGSDGAFLTNKEAEDYLEKKKREKI